MEQFRGHPILLHVSSELFYSSTLVSSPQMRVQNTLDLSLWSLRPNGMTLAFPVLFYPVKGEDELQADTPCFTNPTEATFIAQEVCRCM